MSVLVNLHYNKPPRNSGYFWCQVSIDRLINAIFNNQYTLLMPRCGVTTTFQQDKFRVLSWPKYNKMFWWINSHKPRKMLISVELSQCSRMRGRLWQLVTNDHKVKIYIDQLLTCIYLQCSVFWIKLTNQIWGWIL